MVGSDRHHNKHFGSYIIQFRKLTTNSLIMFIRIQTHDLYNFYGNLGNDQQFDKQGIKALLVHSHFPFFMTRIFARAQLSIETNTSLSFLMSPTEHCSFEHIDS